LEDFKAILSKVNLYQYLPNFLSEKLLKSTQANLYSSASPNLKAFTNAVF